MTARWLFTLALALGACAAPPPPPPPPPAEPAAPVDEGVARKAAEVALGSLAKRKYNVAGCTAAEAKVVATEAEAAAAAVVDERCAVRIARRADKTWLIVVRSPSQLGNVAAKVSVSPGAEGVVHIDYKPE
jgi:hypothetical protein